MALSLNDLKKGRTAKKPASSNVEAPRRMLRPWEDPTKEGVSPVEPLAELNEVASADALDRGAHAEPGKPESNPDNNSEPTKIRQQTGDKPEANTDLKPGPKLSQGEIKTESELDFPRRTIEEASASKPVANREQTGSKPVAETSSKPVANGEQIGSNRIIPHKPVFSQKSKPVAQPVARRVANQEQTSSKPVANPSITHVVGHEQKFLLLIFEECRKEGSLTSPPLTKEFISKSLETSHGTVKSVILRLERKGLVRREMCKVGRGGWLQFSLPRELFQKLLLNETGSKQVANGEQIGSKPVAKPVAQPVADPSSSSSSSLDLNNKRLTTTESAESAENLPPLWNGLDISPLMPIRFGRNHLVQLAAAGKLTPEQVQDSIYAFAFDLEVNGKGSDINGAALNYFMGILRKGPYTPPANYEAPEMRQRRLYLEAKEQQRKKRLELEERLETVEFEEWLEKQPLEQRALLVPPKDFTKPGGTAHNYQLREYFRENVWPQLREEISAPT